MSFPIIAAHENTAFENPALSVSSVNTYLFLLLYFSRRYTKLTSGNFKYIPSWPFCFIKLWKKTAISAKITHTHVCMSVHKK